MDLRTLLDVPVDSIKPPAKWPAGAYHGIVEKYEPGESREKKTPFLRVFVRYTRADESIPEDMLTIDGKPLDMAKGPGGRARYRDYYLTPDSLFMLVDFVKSTGVETEGKNLSSCLPELVHKPVVIELIDKSSQDGTQIFSEIKSLAGDSQG